MARAAHLSSDPERRTYRGRRDAPDLQQRDWDDSNCTAPGKRGCSPTAQGFKREGLPHRGKRPGSKRRGGCSISVREDMVNLGVLVSGSGSNLQAIIDNIEAGRLKARIKIVISNVPHVLVLERANKHGIPSMVISHKEDKREDFDQKLVEVLKGHDVELVIMAGYMRLVTSTLLRAFPMRGMTIHRALLP